MSGGQLALLASEVSRLFLWKYGSPKKARRSGAVIGGLSYWASSRSSAGGQFG
jgi:hypothetical protein